MRSVAFCIALMASLTGCAVSNTVPHSLLQDCPKPTVDVGTAAGLSQGLVDYDAVLQSCNDDKAALRAHVGIK